MPAPCCIKCGHTFFETGIIEPEGSKFRLAVIACKKCGGIIGVMDYHNIGTLIKNLAKKLGFSI